MVKPSDKDATLIGETTSMTFLISRFLRDRIGKVYVELKIEREIELRMKETHEEPRSAYEEAYDVLSHALRGDEVLRERGVKYKGWPKAMVDGKVVYRGHKDQVG
eukprot:7698540-Karenia_brevis.AAC.1